MKDTHPKQTVVAYSAMEEYELAEYAQGIEAAHPDLRIRIERMSTAVLLDRLLTEGPNGQWDIILGWALTTMLAPELRGWFAPLPSAWMSGLPEWARDPDARWFCPSAFVPAFCVNEERLARRGLPTPTCWEDLADPRYLGELVLPDPAYSGAGFLHLTSMIQMTGAPKTWEVMSRIAANRPRIERSAFAPCLAVAANEASVGVTVTIAAQRMTRMGLPFKMVIPADAAGSEPEGFAMREGSSCKPAAARALEWMMTPEACAIYRKYHKVVLLNLADSLPMEQGMPLRPINAVQAAASRARVCEMWQHVVMQSTS
ncbi:extracellular solute-binding protein [Vitiosangium sp. GDMCC 1.1324]|uniref:extracellular solute-binding protein n=1 Tax=Vitiosangium sp. (strain GDMCC 1.1324) TaxID=2138576 RepID=UPI000D38555C|nr:extracellular solute-binding protein [Vitiosangium sp. GDMCC 1.1324]PTL84518.1 ABC transporter permease [Vitiosangium sp. GDMCC 1.1324]